MVEHYVLDDAGTRAAIETLDQEQAALRLDSGRLIVVPRTALAEQPDGTYRVAFSLTSFGQDGTIVIPLVEESIDVARREIAHTVRIHKTVRAQEVVVDEPLHSEDIDVQRIEINRYIDEPLPIRYEGETTIIPLVEEVLVVEKRLLLREELRVTRRQSTVSKPQVYTLRREDVQVERDDQSSEPQI